jgi:hypothetical protein
MKIALFFLLLFSALANALEVDEKLTIRILKVSETRKTVMVNRGTEDGLVEGDHAKFVVTAGIVARAVCVKVSPTRSVWSIYRLVNADFIVNDSVMQLKITPAVKITKDETRPLVQEDTPTTVATGDSTNLGIPLADGAQDLAAAELANADLKALEDTTPTSIVERTAEVFFIGGISGITGNTKQNQGDSFTDSQSHYHIGIGGEYYAQREREWYSRWSLTGDVSFMRDDAQSYNGVSVTNETTELNLGTNWHPFKLPSVVGEFIPFFHLAYGLGTSRSGVRSQNSDRVSVSGQTNSFSVGFGYKIYTWKGFGVRALFDYYLRDERYSKDDAGLQFNKRLTGPRLLLGISYRF